MKGKIHKTELDSGSSLTLEDQLTIADWKPHNVLLKDSNFVYIVTLTISGAQWPTLFWAIRKAQIDLWDLCEKTQRLKIICKQTIHIIVQIIIH